ncbi:MAG: HopJ type III effector protein [Gammaproteobacteria bacterium]|nr:HopJ type III effector protein [Gammaproteobacteria bacterium]
MKHSETLIEKIKSQSESIEFEDIINYIDKSYNYSPTSFRNGPDHDFIVSKAGENEGSCKIFSFALMHKLDKEQTLNCFGRYYRDDVLKHPDAIDHINIRTFMKYGWGNIIFDATALEKKNRPK